MGVVGIARQEVAFDGAEHVVVNLAAQVVGVGMVQLAIIAVEGSQHALEKNGPGDEWWCQLVQHQPLCPAATFRHGAMRIADRVEQVIEELDTFA